MKILIVSTSDIQGGAARAAYRLHSALYQEGIDSRMLVQTKSSDNFRILGPLSKIEKVINRLRPILDSIPVKFYKNRTHTLFSPAMLPFSNIVKKINEINPDIVHLHWVAGGMLRIEDFSKIKAPIVWNIQDMWAFTGGCHYDEECGAFKSRCGNCKVLGSRSELDLSRLVFTKKETAFSKLTHLVIVGVSRWISECAKESSLFKNKPIVNLPNTFNTTLFSPMEKAIVRKLFNIPQNKKIILFGAMNSLGDPRKGAAQLFDALSLVNIENTAFVIAGSSKPKDAPQLKYPTHYIEPLNDEVSLPLMYNTADVMIVPSIQENLANSIIESLACGVPVVAFDIGGNSDMIDHKVNGYLAKPFDAEDMARGIEWVLNHENYSDLSSAARAKVLNTFESGLVARKYIDLYSKILKGDYEF